MKANIIKITLTLSVFWGLAFIAFVDTAAAQGRWTARYTKADVSNIIRRLEESSDKFRNDFDREVDNSRFDGTASERRWENSVQDYENSLDRLREDFDRRDSWWESRSRVQTVVQRAQSVNTIMNTVTFRRNLEQQWNRMRADLNVLADTYDLAGIGGGWTGGGGWGGVGGANRPPSWAIGTWYWNGSSNRTITISNDGRVAYNSNGFVQNGWYSNGYINIGYEQSSVSRIRNGIRLYNRATGDRADYINSGGGGGDEGWDGNPQRPPSWAVGTWYWNGSSSRILTISNNGRVTINSNGTIYRGVYSNGLLMVAGERSTISRNGTGLRTDNQTTGVTAFYRKR